MSDIKINYNQQVRFEMLQKRKQITSKDKKAFDLEITNKLIDCCKDFDKSKYIALYYPINFEADTLAFMEYLLANGYLVCLASIVKHKLVFKPIETIDFKYEYWKNILQPKTNKIINPSNIQTVICPIVAFNSNNERIGYGSHFYLKFMAANCDLNYIGIAYRFQKDDKIVINSKYQKMNKIITD